MQGVWVRSLFGELRSHMPSDQKNKTQNIKQKQCCNKFNKDFINGPHQKKKKKKEIKPATRSSRYVKQDGQRIILVIAEVQGESCVADGGQATAHPSAKGSEKDLEPFNLLKNIQKGI